ncbi:Indole-3-glycerol phosphate synthase [Polystyrenella longa]|uniref:Indole-3-glycerol phosphate synthase n=1 Tax=Polystyrenella longa TaxID=2528007 RepID=A0A518CJW5_9PLAN|nr:indole-3-glycerol phosphate synthase TrpC [Polystyrenella longa]QDU79523.1 Indole-3-glycerol phosphate synthase [Polystyrenella longa]
MSNVLEKIMQTKRGEIDRARQQTSEESLREQLNSAPPVRDFVQALRNASNVGLIAEVKKASPSAGLIRADFDPVQIAQTYESNGANCLSVLTDEQYFQGHLDFLKAVRQAVQIPVLRKEFILDRYQIIEARAAGADSILLIAECLPQEQLADLYGYSVELGMEPLIELYEPENLDRVLSLNPKLVGVNNRNLKTFKTDLEHSFRLRKQVPTDVVFVSESGIKTHSDVQRLVEANVQAMLVGESLMRQPDIGVAVQQLLGTKSPISLKSSILFTSHILLSPLQEPLVTETHQDVEHVLVVPTLLFHELGHFQGFSDDMDRYLKTLLDPMHTSYLPRNEMEEDPSYKQLIPYCIFRHEGKIFYYRRGGTSGESRLKKKRSIGIGGHISSIDSHAESVYREGMRREIEEEVDLASAYTEECVGMINDDETEVGRVHLGVVHVFELESAKVHPREESIQETGFATPDELRQELDDFETWSQICLKELLV